MELSFSKMHGCGNDYIVVDGRELDLDWSNIALKYCERKFSVGADGLLVVKNSNKAPVKMSMYNPDGSEAQMCGNGIRCFTKYIIENEIVEYQQNGLFIETLAGVLTVYPHKNSNGLIDTVNVSMGEPLFSPDKLPASSALLSLPKIIDHKISVNDQEIQISCVSMGNPHAVAFIEDDVDNFPLDTLGPIVENLDLFPERINFHIVNVLDKTKIKARSWERGAGLTLACGTGACAIQAISKDRGFTDNNIDLYMPGGKLNMKWEGKGQSVFMEGPAELVFDSFLIVSQ
ncbi:MAG: diaminopimelate epimerase [Dehalococcoidia bacterium]|jgi:diaminopimelate epimerase|nr:diaminopimelate epimerase [Dehalococcoidia bacterium]|tara:strand:- start:3234 stop:4097 length:864 start_codon:yes stop_codon:yes gene_type:complete